MPNGRLCQQLTFGDHQGDLRGKGKNWAGTRLLASEPQIVLNGHLFKLALSRPPIILEE
jgi:hypothetical protein